MKGSGAALPPYRSLLSWAGTVWLTSFLTCFYSLWPLWRALFPMEIDPNEGWNGYQADAAFGTGVLYPDPAGLIANNYPPLWAYLTGALSRLGFDAVYAGRWLSIFAVIGTAALAGGIVCKLNGSRSAGVLAGFWFAATLIRYADSYVGMNDPHLFALFAMALALFWFFSRDPNRGAEGPVLLTVVAGLFKHTLLATPATLLLVLAYKSPWLAVRALLAGVIAAAAAIVLFTALYGSSFLAQILLYPRDVSITRALHSIARLAGIAPALLLWAVWVLRAKRDAARRFSITFVSLSFAIYLLQKSGSGVDVNAQFELMFAVAIGLGLAYGNPEAIPGLRSWGTRERQFAVVAAINIWLVAAPGLEAYYLVLSPHYRAMFRGASQIVAQETRRVANMPGAVSCAYLTICRAAGKSFVYDNSLAAALISAHRLNAKALEEGMAHQHITRASIDPRVGIGFLQRRMPYGG